MVPVSDLIDTTEMYLRTIYELVEEGIVPLRARIAERLHQSGPTVSQTVARMERDGLLTVEGDRHLELTEEGMGLAVRVMRKHRLAERLLIDVIGLDWEQVHAEACRWEHVMSEAVERRHARAARATRPSRRTATRSPAWRSSGADDGEGSCRTWSLAAVASAERQQVRVRRISEEVQKDEDLMAMLRRVGAPPGKTVVVVAARDGMLSARGETAEIDSRPRSTSSSAPSDTP